jgi:hypothetical protein
VTNGGTPGHRAPSVDTEARGAGSGASLTLGYDGLRVRVVTGDHATLSWLEEFLGPAFERLPDGEADCRVALVEDPDAYRATLALGRAPEGGSADTFAFDHRVLSFPRWAGPALTVWHEKDALFYRVDAGGRRFVVLAEPGNLAARVGLMRAVRELAMGHAGDLGLLLHAAAVAVAGRAVVIAGPTAAGKTTLLLYLLRSGAGAVHYMANDRVRVSLTGARPRARGMPTIVTLRPRTLELFADLAERLRDRGYEFRRGLPERVPGPHLPPHTFSAGRVGLSPAQLADAFDVERVAEGEMAAVVFPTIRDGVEGLSLHRVSPVDAADRLETCLLGSGLRQQQSEIFRLPGARPAPDLGTLRARCRRLAQAVPCLEYRVSEATYGDPASADAVLALVR